MISIKYDYVDDKKNFLSDFNDALGQIRRLHFLYEDSNNDSRKGDLNRWNKNLDAIYRELSPDIDDKDMDSLIFKFKILSINILLEQNKNNRKNYYYLLNQKEIELRKLQELVGKGSSKSFKNEAMM